ncbi:urease accessory protein UreF [Coraliomargarita akajimensis]|uniref:Urease accessory protein UreF n=1 Tax=Coraliomargarita akajimensis (strain DSM 45221 / IAM 15411 / JCM 23193 / KCTC 12865 / 04OKA010-24) TaxID=583355 RepID=D5EM16_CORAD|nr:urease accessory UreF family protein [Coraliomargarita akajimensis]ADE55176.1 Urease accessory protein UreF [Coraliomargarita akajimensis DSM 45221]
MMETDAQHPAKWVASLLQVSDPLFPTGAYAHSMGLEQWAADCRYRSAEDLIGFFDTHAGPALARLELPYLRFAREAVATGSLDALIDLEVEIDAWKWASEIRDASVAQGRGRLRLMRKLWPQQQLVEDYQSALAQQAVYGHHLIVSAMQFELLRVPEDECLMAYGYQSLANYVSASVKLLRISPEAAQSALYAGLDCLPTWVEQSKLIERDAAGWFAPAFDIASARHSTAFSRLFIS